jgi:hypothetical protein
VLLKPQIHASAILLLLIMGNLERKNLGWPPKKLTSIPIFAKIGRLFHIFKAETKHRDAVDHYFLIEIQNSLRINNCSLLIVTSEYQRDLTLYSRSADRFI